MAYGEGVALSDVQPSAMAETRPAPPALSVIVPVKDEAPNIAPLVEEIGAALAAGPAYEAVFIDDGSTDGTARELADAMALHPWLRCIVHARCCGQSAALRTGVRAARSDVIVTLDGDGQNDPADIPNLFAAFQEGRASERLGMVAGLRVDRRDNAVRRVVSLVANGVRRRILGDGAADTGCGIKLFRRNAFLDLPYFDHLHRFLPAIMSREGYEVRFVPVRHRPRLHGRSKYGVWDRLWVGIVDIVGVMWLQRRCRGRGVEIREIENP